MAATYFISDAHLGIGTALEESGREARLLAFFDGMLKTGDSLFILGDLFDYWFEYRSVVPRNHMPVLLSLRDLTRRGVKIHYFAGNHDFWMRDFFPDELGVRVYLDPQDMTIGGKRFWIAHGDGLMKKDRGYRLLKKVLRHPLSIRLYRLLHPDLACAIAGYCSRQSRNHAAFPDEDADYIAAAEECFKEGFDCVVFAHTHRPMILDSEGRTYVNTGDWIRRFTYAKFENGTLTLERWDG
jgi:UDP-2,3-diacylglucosamine hydrolase